MRSLVSHRFFRLPRLAPLVLLLAALPAAAADREVTRSLPAAATGRVEIELFDGSVQVEGWDKNEVQVIGTLRRREDGLAVEKSGGAIEIEVESPDPAQARARLAVMVPRGSSVSIEVLSAAVDVRGVDGEIDIEAVNGDIAVGGKPRQVRAHSVTGGITIATTGSQVLRVDSVSGTVTIDADAREVDGDTVAGQLRLRLRGVAAGRFETVSGGIDAEIVPAPEGRFDFESFSGSIEIAVPAGYSARYDLESATGSLSSKLDGEQRRDGHRLRVEQGSGDAIFRVESFNGSISLRPLAGKR